MSHSQFFVYALREVKVYPRCIRYGRRWYGWHLEPRSRVILTVLEKTNGVRWRSDCFDKDNVLSPFFQKRTRGAEEQVVDSTG